MEKAGQRPESHPGPDQKRHLEGHLQKTARGNAVSQPLYRWLQPGGGEKNRTDHGQVQADRRHGGCGKMSQGIENAHGHRDQSDAQDIRHHDPGQIHGQSHCFRYLRQTRGQQPHQAGGSPPPHESQHDQNSGNGLHDALGQPEHLLPAASALCVSEHGNQDHAQSPFGKEAPKQIGHPERHEKSVGGRAGAKKTGDHHIADKPQNPAGQGRPPRPLLRPVQYHRPPSPSLRIICFFLDMWLTDPYIDQF